MSGGIRFRICKRDLFHNSKDVSFPEAWSKMSENTRRCLVNRFPYGVIYSTNEEEIIILAVMQLNREPGY